MKGSVPAAALPIEMAPTAAQHQTWASLGKVQGGREEKVPEEMEACPGPCSLPKLWSAICTWKARPSGELGSREDKESSGLESVKAGSTISKS